MQRPILIANRPIKDYRAPHKLPLTGNRFGGFTFFELLLVLAIFMVIAAMATPFLLRTFNSQALKSGSDLVRSTFDRARVQSIRSGNVYAFLYSQGASNYTIAPLINAYSLVNPSLGSSLADSPVVKQLPSGLTFVGSSVSQDARAQFESDGAATSNGGMTPILFYPDGTSQDAYLVVANAQGDQIRIHLRGLTGLSTALRVGDEERRQ